MEIKEIPTLEQKQAFWAEQLPNFESKYWLPSHFEFLIFDMDQGNYVIKDDLDPSFEDDATEIWHRVNTGWAMWKKAIKFTEQQATPEGFVLVPKKLSDELNDHLWDFMTDNFISTNEDGDSYIACDDFDLGKFYSEIIEAQEQKA
ncbi:hypothetical protein [Acinetobacter guillouiae]|uniref:Uncharacterized protein n=1 Tax=Acinetobacter guillouiae NIPH 991 TaxID=1217656 RepID=N8X320_ACIGI|nr:hypothetical protein [Acinetobacter guillouiae]ENV18782.1 hypothetical protein F964_00582 [Acinetobacter guillouiae NIPH 991]